jgi:hypothetical protein
MPLTEPTYRHRRPTDEVFVTPFCAVLPRLVRLTPRATASLPDLHFKVCDIGVRIPIGTLRRLLRDLGIRVEDDVITGLTLRPHWGPDAG